MDELTELYDAVAQIAPRGVLSTVMTGKHVMEVRPDRYGLMVAYGLVAKTWRVVLADGMLGSNSRHDANTIVERAARDYLPDVPVTVDRREWVKISAELPEQPPDVMLIHVRNSWPTVLKIMVTCRTYVDTFLIIGEHPVPVWRMASWFADRYGYTATEYSGAMHLARRPTSGGTG